MSSMTDSDILLPRAAGKFIAEHSQDVKILPDGVNNMAKKLLDMMKYREAVLDVSRWDLHPLNPKSRDKAAVDWVFVIDLLNFSFWSESQSSDKYCVHYGGCDWTGYWSLCAAVNRAIDEGTAITDPSLYQNMSRDQFTHVLRSDTPNTSIPLFDERLDSLHVAGKTLCEKFDGSFVNVIALASNSAAKLVQLIVDNFPTFRDVAVYNGQNVALYKRAQILVGDIWACCGGRGYGAFNDIDIITAFADYRIPQSLVHFDVLVYSDSLMQTLLNNEMLDSGDRREVEIRGCMIWAIELIVEEMRRLTRENPEYSTLSTARINSITVDHFLWDYRREHATEISAPFHRTRCIFY